jgi:hypothetical protein
MLETVADATCEANLYVWQANVGGRQEKLQ